MRAAPAGELVENHSQRIYVRENRSLLAFPKLRSHVVGRSAERTRLRRSHPGPGFAGQAEIRDHGSIGSVRPGGQDDVAALEVTVDYLVAVGFSQTGAKLPRDRARFLQRQGSRAEAPFERLALEKLHCEKVDLSLFGGSCVNLEDFADIGVADFRRVARFRRQELLKIRLGRFDGDPALQLLVYRFVHDAHAAASHFAHDAETAMQNLAWLESMLM